MGEEDGRVGRALRLWICCLHNKQQPRLLPNPYLFEYIREWFTQAGCHMKGRK